MKNFKLVTLFICVGILLSSLNGCKLITETKEEKKISPDLTFTSFGLGFKEDKICIATTKWYKDNYDGNIIEKLIPWDIYTMKLMAMISANDSPDIVLASNAYMPSMPIMKILQPVDKYITEKDIGYPNVIDSFRWNGDNYVAYVSGVWGLVTWYNKKLFEEAGLKTPRQLYNEGKWDWDAFYNSAKALTIKDRNDEVTQWGVVFSDPKALLVSNGISFTTIDPKGQVNLTWKSPDFIDAMNLTIKMNKEQLWSLDDSVLQTGFIQNKVAMSFGNNDFILRKCINASDDFKANVVDNAPLPTGKNGNTSVYPGHSNFVGICVGAKNPVNAGIYLKQLAIERDLQRAGGKKEGNEVTLTDAQVEICRLADSKATVTFDNGLGDFEAIKWRFYADIFLDMPLSTAMDTYENQLKKEIEDTMKTGFMQVEKFVAPAALDFEDGSLGWLTQDGLKYTEKASVEVINGAIGNSKSIKVTVPVSANNDGILRTDNTKLKMPANHSYNIKFDYKITQANDSTKFSLAVRPMNSLQVEDGQYVLNGIRGEVDQQATFEKEIKVYGSTKDHVVIFMCTGGGSIIIDNLSITEK